MRHPLKYCLCLFFIFLFSASLAPVCSLEFQEVDSFLPIEKSEYTIESANSESSWRSPEHIPQSVVWNPLPHEGLKLGFSDDIIWLKLVAKNNTQHPANWIWRLNNNRLYDITFFEDYARGQFHQSLSGAQVPRHLQKTPCNGFCYSFHISPEETKTFFLRIWSNTSLRINQKLYSEAHYRDAEATNDIFLGMYYGALLVMLLHTMFAYHELNKKAILISYCIVLVTALLYYLTFDGQLQRILLTDYPAFQHRWQASLGILYTGAFMLFINIFSQARKKKPILFWINITYVVISFVLGIGGLVFLPRLFINKISLNWTIFSVILALIATIFLADFKSKPTRRFFWGVVSLLVATAIFLLWWKDFLPTNAFTMNSLRFGSLIELTFFSMAIGGLIGELDAQRRVSERIAEVRTRFAATVSHEIRTPLTVVLGMADVLDSTELNLQQRKYLNAILSSGKYLQNLVNDVLTFTKLESSHINLNKEAFSVNAMLNEIQQMFHERMRTKDIDFIISMPPESDLIIINDKLRILQVLINLLGNALKFTPNQGIIKLEMNYSCANQRALVQFVVRDNGPGIAPNHLEVIFEEYEQAQWNTKMKYGGTGLGLPISKKIAQALNGKIEVFSQPQEGSTFKFSFGAEIAQKGVSQISKLQLVENFKNIRKPLKILHIDDHEDIRMLFELYFSNTPHTVVSLEDPYYAIEEYERHSFDFIFTDNYMPQMSGLELLAKLRKIDHEKNRMGATFVLCSGLLLDASNNGYNLFDDYLIKPFKKDDLIRMILKHIK